MRVFHIITHFDMGGAERVALNIAESDTTSVEYHIVEVVRGNTSFTPGLLAEMREKGILYHRSYMPEIHFHYLFERLAALFFPLWFFFLYIKYRPKVIHCHTEVPDMAVFCLCKVFPWIRKRLRIIRTIHNTQLWTGLSRTGKTVERFLQKHAMNIAISESVQESYHRHYGYRAEIIYNGVRSVPQKTFQGLRKDKKNVLFAGRMERQKGIATMIEVVSRVAPTGQYHFHIIGDGSLRNDVEKALGDIDNVSIYAPVNGLSAYLSSFDYMFMPSEFEGLVLMSLEAGMASIPVVANRCPGLRETLPDNWQLMVDNNDVEAYVDIFCNVIPHSTVHYGDILHDFVKDKFGVSTMRKKYEERYNA